MIQAIETTWNGYRFRSRLEARWAVFFNALGWRYEYEPEGYLLDGKPYLPDFLLEVPWQQISPFDDKKVWLEIKPLSAKWPEDFEKAWLLAKETETTTWVLLGNPRPGEHWIVPFWWTVPMYMPEHQPYAYNCFLNCRECDEIYLADWDKGGWVNACAKFCDCDAKDPYFPPIGEVMAAYEKATGARFEHGESPKVVAS